MVIMRIPRTTARIIITVALVDTLSFARALTTNISMKVAVVAITLVTSWPAVLQRHLPTFQLAPGPHDLCTRLTARSDTMVCTRLAIANNIIGPATVV
jgi:hypothetical protein